MRGGACGRIGEKFPAKVLGMNLAVYHFRLRKFQTTVLPRFGILRTGTKNIFQSKGNHDMSLTRTTAPLLGLAALAALALTGKPAAAQTITFLGLTGENGDNISSP